MRALLLLFFSLGLFGFAPTMFACSCAGEDDPKQAMRDCDAVFIGRAVSQRIVSIEYHQPGTQPEPTRQVTFEVDGVWKGALKRQVIVMTPVESAACGYAFKLGPAYIVYARVAQQGLHTGACDRTSLIQYAGKDLKALGDPKMPK